MVMYQKRNTQTYNSDAIFGKFNPRKLELNLVELFGNPNTRNLKKQNRYHKRGSSAIWNDDHEFLTPVPTPPPAQKTQQLTDQTNLNPPQVSNFSHVIQSQSLKFQGFGTFNFQKSHQHHNYSPYPMNQSTLQ
jgi:hypothetical protein